MLTLYSKKNCPQCTQAKKLLDENSVAYSLVMADEDMDARSFLLSEGHRSLPQVYKDGKLFVAGGYQGLLTMWRQGTLK